MNWSPHKMPNSTVRKGTRLKIKDYSSLMVRTTSLTLKIDRMKDHKPFIFEVDRSDGEKIKVLYSKVNDTFFQMQEALSENSCFIGKAIMRGKSSNFDL